MVGLTSRSDYVLLLASLIGGGVGYSRWYIWLNLFTAPGYCCCSMTYIYTHGVCTEVVPPNLNGVPGGMSTPLPKSNRHDLNTGVVRRVSKMHSPTRTGWGD